MNEFERFCSLFDQEIRHTFDYLSLLEPGHWTGIPANSDALFLGSRIQKITVSALVRHLMHTEKTWIGRLETLAPGGVLPLPGPPAGLDTIADGKDLVEAYRHLHADNLAALARLSPETLTKELVFVDRRYTGMGFLWSVLGHHAYHLGQIDLVMRQQGTEAPEFMEWPETSRIVG